MTNEEIKIFNSLSQAEITQHPLLLKLLELNGEQLTYYFEEELVENPFIEFEYPIEHRVAKLPHQHIHADEGNLSTQGPSMAQTFETFVYEQIMLYRQTPIRDAMVQMVGLLDERGYLSYTDQELADKLSIDPVIALDAKTLLQQLEPAGVAAYDLRECLMLQTEQDSHAPRIAYFLLENYFEELLDEAYSQIRQETPFELEEILEAVNYYHTLRPRPASLYGRLDRINLIPDVEVKFEGDLVMINVNRQYYPRLRFNQDYYQEMKEKNIPDLLAYIEPHKAAYDEILYCLRRREQLLVAVVKQIVTVQADYLKGRGQSLVPLLIKDLAGQLRLSESIVTTVVADKNLAYGEIVAPLHDFINVSAKVGREGLTALNIQAFIKDILQKQGPEITDQAITDLLKKQEILISSSLVGRYRQNILKNKH